MKIDFVYILITIGIFQGFFIIPLLLRKNKRVGKWIAFLVLIVTLNLCNYLAINLGLYHYWPHFLDLSLPLLFLIGPIYYFYIVILTNDKFKFKKKDVIHLLPFIFATLIYHLEFYLYPGKYKIELYDNMRETAYETIPVVWLIYIAVHVFITLLYLIFSFRLLRKLKFSSTKKNKKLGVWLKRFSLCFGIYWVLTFFWILYLTFANSFFKEVDLIVMLMTSLLINILAYVAIYYSADFNTYFLIGPNKKYLKSSLSNEHSKFILKQMVILMEQEKIYTNPKLKISDIAKRLNTSSNVISQVINQEMEMNFYEFINNYRIAEAMRMLSDPNYSHITILGIAENSGFGSKNTFNRFFKEKVGLTPSQFIRKV